MCFELLHKRGCESGGEGGGEDAGEEIDNIVVKECEARMAGGGAVAMLLPFGKGAADGALIFDLKDRAEEGVEYYARECGKSRDHDGPEIGAVDAKGNNVKCKFVK